MNIETQLQEFGKEHREKCAVISRTLDEIVSVNAVLRQADADKIARLERENAELRDRLRFRWTWWKRDREALR